MNTTKADVTVLMMQIRNMIADEELKSMKEINDVCRSKMLELEMWEYEWLHGESLSYYIIHCEARGKVPVSGYRD